MTRDDHTDLTAEMARIAVGIKALEAHFARPIEVTPRFAREHLAFPKRRLHWPTFKEGLAGKHRDQVKGREKELPTAFVIGAAKSGTTSLTYALSCHPRIAVSHPKEPKFLGSEYHRGWDWYADLFKLREGTKVRIDASTRYTSGIGIFRATPKLMKVHFPKARLIFVCRHPMERMVSHWRHYMGTHPNRTDPFSALLDDRGLARYIVGSSMFWYQLQAYRAHFPDRQILCLTFEDMVSDPRTTAECVLDFLGERSGPWSVGFLLGKKGIFPHKNDAFDKSRTPIPRPEWPPHLYQALRRVIAPDARKFLEHIGKPADFWKDLQ